MKRLALIAVGCTLASGAWAADQLPQAHPQGMTCGQSLARDARYPKQLTAVLAAVADTYDAHAKWVGTGSKEAKAEHDKLQQLAKEHRELARESLKISDMMRSAQNLKDVQHDPARAPVELKDALSRLAQETRTFSRMLDEASQQAAQGRDQLMGTGGAGQVQPPVPEPGTPTDLEPEPQR